MTHTPNKTLGEIIKETMIERGINGSAVARKMKINRQTINKIDARKTFDIEFLQRLKEASGLDFTNYVFNPKHSNYEPLEDLITVAREPEPIKDEQQITVGIKVTGGIRAIGLHFSDLLQTLKRETDKYGFKIE